MRSILYGRCLHDEYLFSQDVTVILNATYVVQRDDNDISASSSFDISNCDVDDTLPIEEE